MSAFHPSDFEPRVQLRITRAGLVFIGVVCVLTHLAAAFGGAYVQRELRARADSRVAEAPKPAKALPQFASTSYLNCTPAEVQRAKEHIFACYSRARIERVRP